MCATVWATSGRKVTHRCSHRSGRDGVSGTSSATVIDQASDIVTAEDAAVVGLASAVSSSSTTLLTADSVDASSQKTRLDKPSLLTRLRNKGSRAKAVVIKRGLLQQLS
jgi:hypothetical protein